MKIIITNTAALDTGVAAILEATRVMLQMAFGRDALFRIHDTSAAPARYSPESCRTFVIRGIRSISLAR